jgi:hypothetical protein
MLHADAAVYVSRLCNSILPTAWRMEPIKKETHHRVDGAPK